MVWKSCSIVAVFVLLAGACSDTAPEGASDGSGERAGNPATGENLPPSTPGEPLPPGPAAALGTGARTPTNPGASPIPQDASGAESPAGVAGGSSSPPPAAPPAQAGSTPSPTGTQANDILDRAEEAYAAVRSLEADFTQRVHVPLLESTQNSRGKIYHRPPDRFLMRFTEPAGDIIVADGRYIWMYYPSTDPRQVLRQPMTQGTQQIDLQREFLSNASERYVATRTGGESVGGRQTHALTLVPRAGSPYRQIRIWVDTQDFLVRRFEISEQNETVRTVEMTNLRPNVALSDELFEFTPPPEAQVFEP